jgi:hypothetical protein
VRINTLAIALDGVKRDDRSWLLGSLSISLGGHGPIMRLGQVDVKDLSSGLPVVSRSSLQTLGFSPLAPICARLVELRPPVFGV